jgi:hypothetical protein
MACIGCKICHSSAVTTGSCSGGSTSDVTCACLAGYYGNGQICSACKACDSHATKSGVPCSLGSIADTLVCTCNVGYYGDGTVCSPCTSGGSSACACAAGYYGYGTVCTPCKTCHASATKVGLCPAGSGSDMVQCTCNAGYYGSGTVCTPCKTCDAHATTPGTCPAGTSSFFTCSCSAGYYGNGVTCAACSAGTYASTSGIYHTGSPHCEAITCICNFELPSRVHDDSEMLVALHVGTFGKGCWF